MPRKTAATYEQTVGRNIARARLALKMTQDQLGEWVKRDFRGEWGKQTVSALENGRRPIEVSELLAIADALGTGLPSLLAPTSDDGSPLPDGDKLLFGDRGKTWRADEIRRTVAPTSDEQAQEVYTKVIQVLAGNVSVDVAPQIAALGLSKPPKRARKR